MERQHEMARVRGYNNALLWKDENSLDKQLEIETSLADVLIGWCNPPQGKMNLDWVALYSTLDIGLYWMNLDWMLDRSLHNSRVPSSLGSSRPVEDLGIQSKRWQEKFQFQVVNQFYVCRSNWETKIFTTALCGYFSNSISIFTVSSVVRPSLPSCHDQRASKLHVDHSLPQPVWSYPTFRVCDPQQNARHGWPRG